MTIDKEEHREILLHAISLIQINWTLEKTAEAEKGQSTVRELHKAISAAGIAVGPEIVIAEVSESV